MATVRLRALRYLTMLVEVALPTPVPRTFTYRSAQPIRAGTRVHVRFGGRRLTGWVIGEAVPRELKELHDVESILEHEPSVPADILELCRWISEYYFTSLGLVLRSALPVVLSTAVRPEQPLKKRRLIRIARELPTLSAREQAFGRAQRQRELYELLEGLGGTAEVGHVTSQLGFTHAIVRALVERELAHFQDEAIVRDPFALLPNAAPPIYPFTSAQQNALSALRAAVQQNNLPAGQNLPFLLHGVTGSGKTLVYIELLREVLAQNRGAIVLVPEIALTPQTVARFRAHFGDRIAVLHSALSEGERYDAWRALHQGERDIAIGARSAVFAPVRNLGAIVVDEEHESTYKQADSAPRYHAREVAVMRARLSGAVCLLGSATPALESWHNAQRGKFRLLELPQRVEGRPLPPVHIIDVRRKRQGADVRAGSDADRMQGVLAPMLVAAIQDRLDRQEQVILLLNRRGYSTFVQCRECGEVWQCHQCNVSLTYHRGRRRLVCHYCFHEEPAPIRCLRCGSGDLSFRGVGTEQVEREVIERFPAARVSRMDVDTTSARWAHHDILGKVERLETDILLGTQMIAKGLDFPSVTLVGVVNADVAMNLPDFRACERTFQLLTQVAGRAGRGPQGGEVLIQTALPNHYAIRSALEHHYQTFADRELNERRSPAYPPHVRLTNVIVSGADEQAVQHQVQHASEWLRAVLVPRMDVELIGPAPCPIDRIRGRWRWHFLIRADRAAALAAACRQLFLRYTFKPGRAALRLTIDRDPVSLL
ncbi:MAG: replication restart helicase PriA [Longimicrobiales bacterium]